jgi:hypothetical protein
MLGSYGKKLRYGWIFLYQTFIRILGHVILLVTRGSLIRIEPRLLQLYGRSGILEKVVLIIWEFAKEAVAVLEIPKKDAMILPGHGWRPPDGDMIKINTDGGMSIEARKGGSGGVVGTSSTYLAAWSKPYPGITDPLIAKDFEYLALYEPQKRPHHPHKERSSRCFRAP